MISRYKSIPITDVSYYNMLCNKRVAIVGPSCNTENTNQGKKIDNYDIVVRLNKSIPIPKKRYKDIGSKTDILYNSMFLITFCIFVLMSAILDLIIFIL